jgi:hypothetical protein
MDRKKLWEMNVKLTELQNKLATVKTLDQKGQEKLNDHISIAYDIQNDVKHLLAFESAKKFDYVGSIVTAVVLTGFFTFMFTSTCIHR